MKLQAYYHGIGEAGTDEAGRGCLAGPVTAAAVILPEGFKPKGLNDSKKLNSTQRAMLRSAIEAEAISFAVCHVSPEEIDRINILQASLLAMHRCLEKLEPQPEFIAVDGNKFNPYKNVPHACVIKGDSKYIRIAAASILAKTYRDDLMANLDLEYPQYDWKNNKGYPTAAHRKALAEFGATPYHRKSFRLLPEQLKLNL